MIHGMFHNGNSLIEITKDDVMEAEKPNNMGKRHLCAHAHG